jgi:hypothetical protein
MMHGDGGATKQDDAWGRGTTMHHTHDDAWGRGTTMHHTHDAAWGRGTTMHRTHDDAWGRGMTCYPPWNFLICTMPKTRGKHDGRAVAV